MAPLNVDQRNATSGLTSVIFFRRANLSSPFGGRMKTIPILVVLLLSLGLGSAFGSSGPKTKPDKSFKKADKQEDKAEKAAFKQQMKNERAACKEHAQSAACAHLKERQKMQKRQFKAEEKAEKKRGKGKNKSK